MYTYYFHGVRVQSEIPLGFEQESSYAIKTDAVDLKYITSDQPPPPLSEPVWVSAETFPDGAPHFTLHLYQEQPLLNIPLTGRFLLQGDTVLMFLEPGAHPAPYMIGKVFGLWLEWNDFPVLHGSCLKFGNCGVGLLGFSGMGKSTLSAALWSRGCALITDDLIPLDAHPPHLVDPGIPISRMWPDTAEQFIMSPQVLDRVHPNFLKVKVPNKLNGVSRFWDEPLPLGAILILERQTEDCDIAIEKIHSAGALMELVRHSYHPDLVRTLGLQKKRMSTLAALMGSVPVFRLSYTSGYDHLPAVCDKVFNHIKGL